MFTKFTAMALAVCAAVAVSGCNDSSAKTDSKPTQALSADNPVMQVSLLRNRLPASCFVKDSDNLAFCMPGDTLIYEPAADKKDQLSVNEVIGGYCDAQQQLTINGSSVICSFRQNRTYNANPVNQRAIVESNKQSGNDYLSQVEKIPGITSIAPGIWVLYLDHAAKDAQQVTKDMVIKVETKLLTPDLRVHSYMLNDLLTLDSLASGNPFAKVFPTLKEGDVVRVYIDYKDYPDVWNVDSSLQGQPYIWEIHVQKIEDKQKFIQQQKEMQQRAMQLQQQQQQQQQLQQAAEEAAKAEADKNDKKDSKKK